MDILAYISIGINPNIAEVGPFLISWHGLFTALGILTVIAWAAYQGRKHKFHDDLVYGTAIWAVLGGVVGARLVHVIDHWDYYIQNPLSMLLVYEGGIGLLGAIFGATVAGSIYAWRNRYPVGRMVDLVTPGLLAGQFVGRIGDIINGEHLANISTAPFAFLYTHLQSPANGQPPMHPAIAYEMIWDVIVGVVTYFLIGRLRPHGSVFFTYLLLYGLGRFLIQFVRRDAVWFLGLQQAHLLSLALVAIGVTFLITRVRLAATTDEDSDDGSAGDEGGSTGEANPDPQPA